MNHHFLIYSGCCGFRETSQPRRRQQVRLRHFRPLAQVQQHRHVRKPTGRIHRRSPAATPARKNRTYAERKRSRNTEHEQQRVPESPEHQRRRRQEISVAAAEPDFSAADERDRTDADAPERSAENRSAEEAESPIWQQQQQHFRQQLR